MTPRMVGIDEALDGPLRFDALIDARSPSEFAADRLPGAVNWPVLDDAQRREVGTLYKQVSALEARKIGAAMVARNIAAHLEREIGPRTRDWQPLVYCWRGGQRSGSLAWFLAQIGYRTAQLQGGYKAFRERVRRDLDELPARLDFVVLAGRTGSGKTRLLQALAEIGAQVLDLEGIACHRGSVLGALPGRPQPTQKRFDTLLWEQLRRFDPARPVFVESESAKIGTLAVPPALLTRMREHGRVVRVHLAGDARLALLLEDYAFFADDVEGFCARLQALVPLRGHGCVERWQAAARAGHWRDVFADLMTSHYDPLYEQSMRRSFAGLHEAAVVDLDDGGTDAVRHAAARLLDAAAGGTPR